MTEIIDAIQTFNDTILASKWLVQPTMQLRSENLPLDNANEVRAVLSLQNRLAYIQKAA